jgi:hypothetical protein
MAKKVTNPKKKRLTLEDLKNAKSQSRSERSKTRKRL